MGTNCLATVRYLVILFVHHISALVVLFIHGLQDPHAVDEVRLEIQTSCDTFQAVVSGCKRSRFKGAVKALSVAVELLAVSLAFDC